MDTARVTRCKPFRSFCSTVRTSKPAMEETSFSQKSVSGLMSGVGFWPLGMNCAGGALEYKVLNENMPAGVSDAFHFSTPSNAGEGDCATALRQISRTAERNTRRLVMG